MKKIHTALFAMLTTPMLATSAMAADWTPYLKGMQNTCDYGNTLLNILGKKTAMPQALKADVVRHTAKGRYPMTDSDFNLTLKNATAFGQPITRIHYSFGAEGYSSLTVYFANRTAAQTAIKQFYVQAGNKKYPVGTKQTLLVEYDYSNNNKFISSRTVTQAPKATEYGYDISAYADSGYSDIYLIDEQGWTDIAIDFGNPSSYLSIKNNSISCTFTDPT